MPTYQAILQRERYDYAHLEIEAKDEEEAADKVTELLANGQYPDHWETGDASDQDWDVFEALPLDIEDAAATETDAPLSERGFGT